VAAIRWCCTQKNRTQSLAKLHQASAKAAVLLQAEATRAQTMQDKITATRELNQRCVDAAPESRTQSN
jgi:hypothetical protein